MSKLIFNPEDFETDLTPYVKSPISGKGVYSFNEAREQILVEALKELRLTLTPRIPRQDGMYSWTIQQKFIDKIVRRALDEIESA